MKPAPFKRHLPSTVREAVEILSEYAPQEGRVIAGGQSLIPMMAFRMARPAHLIDIAEVDGLDRLTISNDALKIGARVRHASFHLPQPCGVLGPLLTSVVKHIAHYPIRIRGTFCGSIAHADPSSEWCLVVVTLDAAMIAASTRGDRTIPATEYFKGILSTALTEDELLTEVSIPLLPVDTKFGFSEFSRRAGDFAMSAALVTYRLDRGRMIDVHLGVGGAEPHPRRITEAEAMLNGEVPGNKLFLAVSDAVAKAVDAMEDHQTSAEYRRNLVRAVVRRALDRASL